MIRGILAGSFDIIHPGYIKMFIESKNLCDWLIVALHEDPSIERPSKSKPILSLDERKDILLSIKYIDEIISYQKEIDFYNILKEKKIDIRILGDDYLNKDFTGKDLNIKTYFINRSHGWSSTKMKDMICSQ